MHFNDFLNDIRQSFDDCSSEHRLFKKLEDDNYASKLNSYAINKSVTQIEHLNTIKYIEKTSTGIMMPISFQFQTLFGRDYYLIQVLADIRSASTARSNVYGDFINSELWK